MTRKTFLDLARVVLMEERRPLSAEEIWAAAKAKGYDKEVSTRGKTPCATMGSRIYCDMRDNADSAFLKTGSKPTRFCLRELPDQPRAPAAARPRLGHSERDLHPFLTYYAYHRLGAYVKTVEHPKSKKKEFGEWVHPDMVGCHFRLGEWKPAVVELSSTIGNVSIKLFSFEIKKELDFSNLRESFFQTVSNSSWANEGYLVASDISDDAQFLNELKRLSSSFGIGVIKIAPGDPDAGEVVFVARFREYLDWDAINKLTMNKDFEEFLKRIRNDIFSNEIRQEHYDRIASKQDLIDQAKLWRYRPIPVESL